MGRPDLDDARTVLARQYPDIEDDDALCADCLASVHVRDGAEWQNGHDTCDACTSRRLDRTERALAVALAEVDRLRQSVHVTVTVNTADLRREIADVIHREIEAFTDPDDFAVRLVLTELAERIDRGPLGTASIQPARVERRPVNGWPILVNGDCEGDGEPEILCEACGEEGYACYCGAYPQDWARFVCPYCGEDCGETGCHDTSDPDVQS